MSRPILRARATVELRRPAVSGALITAYRSLAPLYLRLAFKVRSIRLIRASTAVEAARDFQEGRSRLIFAFRHPYGHEPEILGSAIVRSIPAAARSSGRPLPKPLHAHFIHGHEVALWSGPLVRWVLPRAGALPVHHVKFDADGMERIRRHMLDGAYPLALAPEGQVSYSSSTIPRLERGFASIAFRCAEDLDAAGRPERVTVLPLSIHLRYGKDRDRILADALGLLEKECGIAGKTTAGPQERLRAAAEAIVGHAEEFYAGLGRLPTGGRTDASLNERWSAVLEAALDAGECAFGLRPDGDLPRRLYRIRQAGWDRIYRGDLGSGKSSAGRSPLFRALADRGAGQAWYAMRHMELADIGSYMDFEPLAEDESDLLIERAVNYLDLTSRLRGGNITDRLVLARADAVIVAGEPLELRERLGDYRAGRKSALDAAKSALETRYLDCIDLFRKEYADGER